MLEEAEARLVDLASAVADGRSLDWNALESSTEDPDERAVIKRLRAIADVGRVHAEISFHGPFTITESFGSTPDPPPVQPGERWGSLQILEKVGRGRFGDVYRAWDPSLDREVALKLLRREDERAEDQLLVEEGRLMARVHHPHVVTIYGAQRIDGRTGLWMEFVRGRTLEAELRERGPFEGSDLLTIGVELCRALTAVHVAGLVHRDVKAQNVLRDSHGHVLLGDFGTGRELDEAESDAHEIAGTPAYLAPEIFNRARATPQSDIYSLGALLFHLATGTYPVQGRSLRELRDAHARGERTPLRRLRPDLSDASSASIERALSPLASDRFSNAADMERALSDAIAPKLRTSAPGRPAWHFTALGAVTVVAIVIGVWLAMMRASNSRASGDAQRAVDDARRVMRQISPDSNLAGPGVPSPDGRLLSFVDGSELALFEIASRRRWRITGPELSGDPPGWVEHSRFSLDGSRLTYLRFSNQYSPPRPEIRMIPLAGGNSRVVWRGDDGRSTGFQHSNADDLILVTRDMPDGESELLVISTDDGTVRTSFAVPSLSLVGASLSSDGQFVAYERPDPSTGFPDIYVRDVNTGSEAPLVHDVSSDQSPVWTRDGKHLLFVSYRSGSSSLWMQPVEDGRPSGRPTRIEPNLGWAYPMGGITDRGALFFRRQMGTRDVYVADIDPVTLAVSGEPQRVSAEGVGANGSSAWSPDGTRLAFFRRNGDQRMRLIVKSMVDAKEQEFWKPHLEGISRPRWEADGRTLLFKASLSGRSGLFRLDLESGDISTVMERVFNEYELMPQPGVMVYSVRASREVIRRDLVTGQETVIHRVPAPSTLVEMALSNRGDRLAYSSPLRDGTGRWALRVIDLGLPQRVTELLQVAGDEFIGAYAWSLDDRDIIIKRAKDGANPAPDARHQSDESRLWAVDAKTGQAKLIGLNFDGLNQVQMRPDGRRLSFDGGWPFQEVWALDHVLAALAP